MDRKALCPLGSQNKIGPRPFPTGAGERNGKNDLPGERRKASLQE